MDLRVWISDTLLLREETSPTSVYPCSNGVPACSIPITSKLTRPPPPFAGFGKDMTGRERPELDEITQHINASWFGDTNSLWRLFEFRLNEMSPSVEMLAIHPPNEQFVLFNPNEVQTEEELQQVIESRQRTSLTAFFELNRNDPEARQYVYPEILRKYR